MEEKDREKKKEMERVKERERERQKERRVPFRTWWSRNMRCFICIADRQIKKMNNK